MMNVRKEKRDAIAVELENIRRRNKRGVLVACEVVDAARHGDNVMHDHFEWDDAKAAHEHRLEQARALIRVVVMTVNGGDENAPQVPFYLSLPKDRGIKGGGYRPTKQILGNAQMKRQLLESIGSEFQSFRTRWGDVGLVLKELSPVMKAHEAFQRQYVNVIPARKKIAKASRAPTRPGFVADRSSRQAAQAASG